MSNHTMKTFQCVPSMTVIFDPSPQYEQPCISTVPSFMLNYEGGFTKDGNMKLNAEVGTFADTKYSGKTQRNASQAFED